MNRLLGATNQKHSWLTKWHTQQFVNSKCFEGCIYQLGVWFWPLRQSVCFLQLSPAVQQRVLIWFWKSATVRGSMAALNKSKPCGYMNVDKCLSTQALHTLEDKTKQNKCACRPAEVPWYVSRAERFTFFWPDSLIFTFWKQQPTAWLNEHVCICVSVGGGGGGASPSLSANSDLVADYQESSLIELIRPSAVLAGAGRRVWRIEREKQTGSRLQPWGDRDVHGGDGGNGRSSPGATVWWNVGLMRSWRSAPSAAPIPSVPALPSPTWLCPDSQSRLARGSTSGAAQKSHFHPGALKWLHTSPPPPTPLPLQFLWECKCASLARIGFLRDLARSGYHRDELDAQDEVWQNHMTHLVI